MFKNLLHAWREARGQLLRKEFEDAVLRLPGLGEEANLRTSLTLANAYEHLTHSFGSLANVSREGKRALAKALRKDARQCFALDMGRGYGFALLSMYVESQILPGTDAAFVHHGTREFLEAALQIKARVDHHEAEHSVPNSEQTVRGMEDDGSGSASHDMRRQQDEAARSAIAMAKYLGGG